MSSEGDRSAGQRPEGAPDGQEWRALAAISYRVARAILRNHDDALDVGQRTLVLAFLKRAAIQNLPAWVAAVARRLAWRALSRQSSEPAIRPLRSSDSPLVHDRLYEVRLLLAQVLERLPTNQALVLMLCARGFTHREIATALGCKIHQVGPRLARAQRNVRKLRDAPHAHELPTSD